MMINQNDAVGKIPTLFNYKKDVSSEALLTEALGITEEILAELTHETILLLIRILASRDGKKSTMINELSTAFGGKTCDEIAFMVHHLLLLYAKVGELVSK